MKLEWVTASLLVIGVAFSLHAERGLTAVQVLDAQGGEVALYGQSHALVVGVSEYDFWPDLRGVLRDVAAVQKVLEDHGFQVHLELNPDSDRLRERYRQFINRYGQEVDNRLLFYFAGHGYTMQLAWGGDMGYIAPTDAPNPERDKTGFLEKALDMEAFEGYAKRIQAKHALFLFDSCFSGSIFALSREPPRNISDKTALPVRQFITSGQADETVPDESVFRDQFVRALEGEGDWNQDGYVTAAELGEFLHEKVVNYTDGAQHPQYGKIRNPMLDRGDFVFVLPRQNQPAPALPGEPRFDLSDIMENVDTEREWRSWQANMDASFKQVQQVFRMSVTDRFKQAALQRFLSAYAEDNPFSESDNELREWARDRLATAEVEDRPAAEPETAQAPPEEPDPETHVARHGPRPGKPWTLDFGTASLEMVWIEPGTFTMGDAYSDGRNVYEPPRREVTLTEGFWLGRHEVTQRQWEAVMSTNPSRLTGAGKDAPVESVSWSDADSFCRRVTLLEQEAGRLGNGYMYTLPTDAQWEYACRAGTTTDLNSGRNLSSKAGPCPNLDELGWYNANSGGRTHAVGQKAPNAWGLFDMHGNVSEWCADWFDDELSTDPVTDPVGPVWGSGRVSRGGSWRFQAQYCRSGIRERSIPSGDDTVGFRLCLVRSR